TSIEREAFSGCSSLTSIIIPESVTSIGSSAFSGCSSLTSIIIPQAFHSQQKASDLSLPHLWPDGFFPQSNLGPLTYEIADGQVTITDCDEGAEGELEIPAEIEGAPVTSIGEWAFRSCSSLTSIIIPEGVTSIGLAAFSGCSSLSSIVIPQAFHSRSEANRLIITHLWPDGFFLPSNLSPLTYEIADGQVTITGCNWQAKGELEIPAEIEGAPVTSIGEWAFRSCSSLTSIIIPEGVNSIGLSAFIHCKSLTSIIIPESVTSIETFAFFNCSSLTSIVIPQAFHSRSEANRLKITHLWPDGFFLPSSITHTPKLSIRLPLQLILTGDENTKAAIEATDTLTGPWTEWRTIVIGENGTTEVDLDEGAEQRFYRVRN
ncbi:MAG: leucine-rich repeat domain-containing protein, partial [Verrucomicrobia bacterium]|nr:leucine-rich repeat domain-containing protein [Verrucomicrobiota bacterium]